MCAKEFKQMLSAARLTVALLGPARQRERAKKREKRTLAYLQQFDNCHDVAVALIMALNSGSLCCELAVCEYARTKVCNSFLAALHANTFSSMFWFPSLSLSLCLCLCMCGNCVHTH